MIARRAIAVCARIHITRNRAKRRTCRPKQRFHQRWILHTLSRSWFTSNITGRPRAAARRKLCTRSAAHVCTSRCFRIATLSSTTATRSTCLRCLSLRSPYIERPPLRGLRLPCACACTGCPLVSRSNLAALLTCMMEAERPCFIVRSCTPDERSSLFLWAR